MFAYILKRLLLMIPTLLGVLLLTFIVIQFVPGGPVEQYLAEAKAGGIGGTSGGAAEGGGMTYRGSQGVDPNASNKSRRFMASTSRRTNVSSRWWASLRGLIWARAFFKTRRFRS